MDLDQIHLSTNEGSPSETQWEKEMRARWRASRNEEERYEIQREWFCTKRGDDKPQNDLLRAKWTGLFSRHLPILEIMAMAQEDTDKQLAQLRENEDRLANLKLAQAAHKKKKISTEDAKREKRDAQMAQNISQLCYPCANEGCHNLATVIDLDHTTIECEICRQLDQAWCKVSRLHNGWFCTEECKKEGELAHQIKHHPCASKSSCIERDNRAVFTLPTHEPPTKSIVLCLWCMESADRITYFCSEACAEKNLDEVHKPEDDKEWLDDREEDFEEGEEDSEMTY